MCDRIEKIAYARGYRVLEDGKMINPKGKELKGSITRNKDHHKGYRCTGMKVNGKSRTLYFHRLQAYQKFGAKFIKDPKPAVARHLDGDSLNNACNNIAMGPLADRAKLSPEARLKSQGRARRLGLSNRKHSDKVVESVIADRLKGMSYKAIGDKHGVSTPVAYYMVNSKTRSEPVA